MTSYSYKNVLLLHIVAQRADPAFQSVLKQIALKSIKADLASITGDSPRELQLPQSGSTFYISPVPAAITVN